METLLMRGESRSARGPRLLDAREIGPRGTIARITAGVAAFLVAVLTDRFTRWNLAAGMLGLPVVAILALEWSRSRGRTSTSDGCTTGSHPPECPPWRAECALLALITVVVIGMSFVSPIDEGSIWMWLGSSFLLSSILGYSGCEMVAIPNLVTGKQHRIGCFLFSSIDRADARRRTMATLDSGQIG